MEPQQVISPLLQDKHYTSMLEVKMASTEVELQVVEAQTLQELEVELQTLDKEE